MNKYESVIIVNPNIEEEDLETIIKNVKELINQDGEFKEIDKIGLKKLAYEIKGNKEGYYIVFYFNANFGHIANIEKYYRNEEKIMKFIVVRMDE